MGTSQLVLPPIDRSRKALKWRGRFASKALHIALSLRQGFSRPFLRNYYFGNKIIAINRAYILSEQDGQSMLSRGPDHQISGP